MTYKTCVTIAEKTPKKLDSILKKALKKSDYAELRFDFLKPIQVPDALELVKKKLGRCVCTLRPVSEGGKFHGSEKERISILKLIAEYRPFLLDIEFNTMRKNKTLHNYVKKTKSGYTVEAVFNQNEELRYLRSYLGKTIGFHFFIHLLSYLIHRLYCR